MINKLHERAPRIVLNGQSSNSETLFAESSDIFYYIDIFKYLYKDI